MRITCKNCKHEWEYKGNGLFYASCPVCHYKVKIPKVEEKNVEVHLEPS